MGRGRSGKSFGSKDGTLQNVEETHIETRVYLPGSRTGSGRTSYKDEVLEAETDGNGNLTFSYARPADIVTQAKTNQTGTATFNVRHGALNGETFGIDWSKVKSISGQTYNLRDQAKRNGLKWNGEKKRWERR